MSTPNFSKQNASKFYAIELQDDYEYEDLVGNLQYAFGIENKTDKWDGNRNYEGKIISQLDKNLGNYNVCFDIIIRSGYYSGANLDWNVMITDENSWDKYEYGYYEDKNLPKYIHNYVTSKIKSIEKVFAQNSMPLYCKGIFSNGEAIYAKY